MFGNRQSLAAWDERRYNHYITGCTCGFELKKPGYRNDQVTSGLCLHELEDQAKAFVARNRSFFVKPPDGWYRLVEDLRARTQTDARPWHR